MIFEEEDSPPFLDLNANVHDRVMSAVEKAKEVATSPAVSPDGLS